MEYNEFVISTPSGRRRLLHVPNSPYCGIMPAFAEYENTTAERLVISSQHGEKHIVQGADGVRIAPRLFLSGAVKLISVGETISASEIERRLSWWPMYVRETFNALYASFDLADRYWQTVHRFARWNPVTGELSRIA